MRQQEITRRVSALLHADVAGYTSLSQEDEELTYRQLSESMAIVREVVRLHQGRVVDQEGDCILVESSSVSAALITALEIQETLEYRAHQCAASRQLRFRIGIHLAEIGVDGQRDRLFGHGVNVAARLQQLAEPGGICVSEAVRNAAPANLDIRFETSGSHQLKNVFGPMRAYRVRTALVHSQRTRAGELDSLVPARAEADRLAPGPGPQVAAPARATHTELTRMPMLRVGDVSNELGMLRECERLGGKVENQQRVSPRLDRAAAAHSWLLRTWLLWMRRRFGRRRTLQWRLGDFCLLHAFLYAPLSFFVALTFLGGSNHLGSLSLSVLEVGAPTADSPLAANELGAVPLLLLIGLVYGALYWTARAGGRQAVLAHRFDLVLVVAWLVSLIALGFALALSGFGVALMVAALSVSLVPLRRMPGVGVFFWLCALGAVLALWFISASAAAGDPAMVRLATALHDLTAADIDRLLILWAILPVLNALFDYLSWRASRHFALAIYGNCIPLWLTTLVVGTAAAMRVPITAGVQVRCVAILYWGLLDLLVAVLFLLTLAATIGGAVELLDVLRHAHAGTLDLASTVAALSEDPLVGVSGSVRC